MIVSGLAAGNVPMPEIRISRLNLFNPMFDYRHFMISALVIMLIVML